MCLSGFDFCFRAHNHASASRKIGFTYAAYAIYISSCREVGRFYIFHQFLYGHIFIVKICFAGIDDFRQIMGRHVGCHTYSNTGSTVNQQIRNTCRHHFGFHQRIIEVRFEIYSLFVEVLHHFFT